MEEKVINSILSDISSAEIIKENFDSAVEGIANKLREQVLEKLKTYYPNAEIENASSRVSSKFIPVKNGRLGLESFNGKGIFKNKALFIGLLKHNQETQRWEWENCVPIYDKDNLYRKLQDFVKGDFSVVNTIINSTKEYIQANKLVVT